MYKSLGIGYDRQFTCMKLASEAGLAPRVWYTSVEDRLSITDFVNEVPFSAREALVRLPAILRRLHSVPPFPKGVDHMDTTCMFLTHKTSAAEDFFRKFQAANVLSGGDMEQLLAWHARFAAAYQCRDADMVSSHNDVFKPDNILFDGQRVWLVDWEAAFLNDRYVDLAVIANLIVMDEADEPVYLREYFGEEPSEYQLARFFLMQQLAHMFYAVVFLMMGSAGQPMDWSPPAPSFRDIQRRMWAGELNVAGKEAKIAYGRAHWERLVENMRSPRLEEAFKIVSERHAYA